MYAYDVVTRQSVTTSRNVRETCAIRGRRGWPVSEYTHILTGYTSNANSLEPVLRSPLAISLATPTRFTFKYNS